MLREAVDEEHRRGHDHHELDHHPGEVLDALVKRRLHQLARKAGGHLAKIRLGAGGQNHPRGGTAFHARAEKTQVGVLDGLDVRARIGRITFFNRERFAGERGLNDEEILGGDQPHVAGNHVAGGKFHHIAGHQLFERNFPGLAAAHHRGRDLDHRLELGGRVIGLGFLNEPQRNAEHHHGDHHPAADRIAAAFGGGERDNGEHGQQHHQGIADRQPKPVEPVMLLLLAHLVRAKNLQPFGRLLFRQTGRGGVEPLQNTGGIEPGGFPHKIRRALALGRVGCGRHKLCSGIGLVPDDLEHAVGIGCGLQG